MSIFRFLWKYKIGAIIAGVIAFPVSVVLVLYTSCALTNIIWSVGAVRLGGVGEACATIWIVLLFHLFNLVVFLFLGAIIERFVRRLLHKIA